MSHYQPINASDRVALFFTKSMRFFADTFFQKRYGHRAVVLETVAGVPGMVAGMWTHLTSLRKMKTGYGPKIRTLLDEAENERMHLMTFIEIAKPNAFERILVLIAQAIFWNMFFLIYVFFQEQLTELLDILKRRRCIPIQSICEKLMVEHYRILLRPKSPLTIGTCQRMQRCVML